MIKNKISPELKKAFLESIEKTRDRGREEGFLICLDKDGKLYASKRCEGGECGFIIENSQEYCPDKVQGAYHTHPYFINVEKFYGHKPSKKELSNATKIYKKHFDKEGVTFQTPSHHDLVDTLLGQCMGESEGTVCTGNDLDLDKVECWTVKSDKVNVSDCTRATIEHKLRISESPRKWLIPLFDREIVELNGKAGKKKIEMVTKYLKNKIYRTKK